METVQYTASALVQRCWGAAMIIQGALCREMIILAGHYAARLRNSARRCQRAAWGGHEAIYISHWFKPQCFHFGISISKSMHHVSAILNQRLEAQGLKNILLLITKFHILQNNVDELNFANGYGDPCDKWVKKINHLHRPPGALFKGIQIFPGRSRYWTFLEKSQNWKSVSKIWLWKWLNEGVNCSESWLFVLHKNWGK